MAKNDLSPRQRDVLDYIRSALMQQGFPPTYREMGDALGISSTNGVADHVKALVRKGYLEKSDSGAARGLKLTQRARPVRRGDTLSVPVIGHVAAGTPIMADENYERSIHLDRSLVPENGAAVYALRVRGDSMMEEGILDGDIVIVRQQNTARNGEIVVALIDEEATVKFYYHEGGRIRLQPAHPTMAPIYVDPSQASSVQGIVVGVYRQYH
jgi:repressor LexA